MRDSLLFLAGAGVGGSLAILTASRRRVSARKALQQTFQETSQKIRQTVDQGRRATKEAIQVTTNAIDLGRMHVADAADAVSAAVRPR